MLEMHRLTISLVIIKYNFLHFYNRSNNSFLIYLASTLIVNNN